MFESLIKEFQQLESKLKEKLQEIEGKSTEEELYNSVELKNQMWSSVDAVKGSSMLREDVMKKPFNGAFPDVFRPSKDKSKEETLILKKYIYTKGLEELI